MQVSSTQRWMLFVSLIHVDIYCYSCNDAKLDPELASHLAAFGINVQTQTKTEKSMTELVRPIFLIVEQC